MPAVPSALALRAVKVVKFRPPSGPPLVKTVDFVFALSEDGIPASFIAKDARHFERQAPPLHRELHERVRRKIRHEPNSA